MKLEIDINSLTDGWHNIGDVAVETGTLLLVDPSLLSSKVDINNEVEALFVEFHQTLLDNGLITENTPHMDILDVAKNNDDLRVRYGEIMLKGGTAVASKTGIGDGNYPVYAKVEWDPVFNTSRVVGLWVDFLCGSHTPVDE